MSKSDIFDNYVKIAKEKGMISADAPEKAAKTLSKTHRADSLDISAIEALYGVKPDAPKSMEYKRNIMEIAHPNSVVVSPSYDKLNGLVENNNERQDIMLNIVNRPQRGMHTYTKYAEKELILTLVRLGNQLDLENKDELRILADACLVQLTDKSLTKKAVGPLMIVGLAASLIGAIYAHQHLPNLNEGLTNNYNKLISELNDFLNSNSNFEVGHEYDAELKKDVQGLKDRLEQFYGLYQRLSETIRELERPKDAKELMQIAAQPETKVVLDAVNKLKTLITNINSYMDMIVKNFSSDFYKKRHTTETGFFTGLLEKTRMTGGNTALFGDDFQDVLNAIAPFKGSVVELLKMLEESKTLEGKAAADLATAQAKTKSEFGDSEGEVPVAGPKGKDSGKSLEDELGVGDLEESLRNDFS